MIAVALSLAVFLFWLLVGLATLDVLYTRRNILGGFLLAPSIGMAVTLLLVVTLNRAGLPIGSFSVALTVALLLASLVLVWWRRPPGSLRRYGPVLKLSVPFVGMLVLAFLMTGRPMIEYAWDWISYANDDMAVYAGEAQRYAARGAFDPPNVEAIVQGLDYPEMYWVIGFSGQRVGTSPLLSWLMALTGHAGHEVYMPAMLALHLALIGAAGALVAQGRRARLAAGLTCAMLSLSALMTLGVLYQLMPQVAGLALLAAATLLLLRFPRSARRSVVIRQGALVGLVGAAIFIAYPEVLPFLGIGYIIFVVIGLARHRRAFALPPGRTSLTTAALVCLVSLNSYVPTAFFHVIDQAAAAGPSERTNASSDLFPHYRVPSGFADLWGFQPVAPILNEPLLSIAISLGMLLLIVVAGAAIWQSWRLQPVAIITLVMLMLGMQLFHADAGFGLFKLAMFIQPFMLGTLVVGWLGLVRSTAAQIVPLIVLGLLSVPGQLAYVNASRGVGSALIELREPSSTRINAEFQRIVEIVSSNRDARLLLDTPSLVLSRFQSVYVRGIRTHFESLNPYRGLEDASPGPLATAASRATMAGLKTGMSDRDITGIFPWFTTREEAMSYANLVFRSDPRVFHIDTLGHMSSGDNRCDYIVGLTERQSIFNRRKQNASSFMNYFVQPCNGIQNHLVFIDSPIGRYYYTTGSTRVVSVYQLENDLMFPGGTMMGIGRRLLLRVLNPSDAPRLVVSMTATLKADGENRLPPAVVIASERLPLPVLGRGSARIFSSTVTPLVIAERSFIGLDMGVDSVRFPIERSGLMALFGREVNLDNRYLVAFARDISLISDEQYAHLAPPQEIHRFPSDLMNPDLEYSGIYEDGWISEAAFFGLMQPSDGTTVVARGMVPQIDDPSFTTELRLLVDGQAVACQAIEPGDFELVGSAPAGAGRRRVELRFSAYQQLPGRDRRPVAARMEQIGFESARAQAPAQTCSAPVAVATPAAARLPWTGSAPPADVEHPGVHAVGLATDGWLADVASVDLTQPAASAGLVVRGMVPLVNDPGFITELQVLVDGQEVARQALGLGDFELRAPVPGGPGQRHVELRFSATQALPAPDGRAVGARAALIGFEPSPQDR